MFILINLNFKNPILFRLINLSDTFSSSISEAEIEIGRGGWGEWTENDEYNDHFLSQFPDNF